MLYSSNMIISSHIFAVKRMESENWTQVCLAVDKGVALGSWVVDYY